MSAPPPRTTPSRRVKIVISSLEDVPRAIRRHRPSHMITLLDPDSMIETPRELHPERHLKLGVNDIAEPAEGLIHPTAETVEAILKFGATWEPLDPMLVHCWAGISRSSATAFILACERNPETSERLIAEHLRRTCSAGRGGWPTPSRPSASATGCTRTRPTSLR